MQACRRQNKNRFLKVILSIFCHEISSLLLSTGRRVTVSMDRRDSVMAPFISMRWHVRSINQLDSILDASVQSRVLNASISHRNTHLTYAFLVYTHLAL